MKKFLCGAVGLMALTTAALVSPAWADGTLRVAIPANINTMDAAKTKAGEEYIISYLVFSGLTEITADGKVKSDLAESWTSNDDQTEWTFKLRKGVKFQDGRPMEAADVKASIERVMDKSTGSTARANFSIITSITVTEPDTVVFKLKLPYAGFPDLLGDRQARIMPRDKFDSMASNPIGTGPFKFKEYVPGDHITLVKNPDYFVKGEPKLDEVKLRIMPESAAEVAALQAGEVDMIWSVPLESLDTLKKDPNIKIDSVATSTWDGLIMNSAKKPFDDVRVRKAVLMSLDKQALVEFALYGQGTPTHTMIPPSSAYYNKDLPKSGPNVAEAKKLLAEAGYPHGFKTTLYLPVGRPTRERLGVAAKQFLGAIGIDADLQRVPWDTFVKEIEGKAAFYVDGFYARPTIDTSIYPFYHSTGSWNNQLWNYSNPDVDKVLDAARAEKDPAKREALYKKFQKLVEDKPAGAIPYVLNHIDAYRSNVQGFHAHPMMWLDLRDVSLKK